MAEDISKSSDSVLEKDIRFCIENDVDYIIHSIYQDEKEIQQLQNLIFEEYRKFKLEETYQSNRMGVRIIAKLENEAALMKIQGILEKADSILIPRGVLGTVLPIEKISWI